MKEIITTSIFAILADTIDLRTWQLEMHNIKNPTAYQMEKLNEACKELSSKIDCGCQHDCCGHIFQVRYKAEERADGRVFVMKYELFNH